MTTSQQLDIIYHASQRYTDRIHLVQQAMRDLNPVMLSGFSLKTASHAEIVEYCEQLDLVPSRGFWRDSNKIEWRYTFHGGGLRLIQVVTQEPLDWDADMTGHPDLDAFDHWFFITWLQWYFSTHPDLQHEFPEDTQWRLVDMAFKELMANGSIIAVVGEHGKLYKVARK